MISPELRAFYDAYYVASDAGDQPTKNKLIDDAIEDGLVDQMIQEGAEMLSQGAQRLNLRRK